MHIPCGSGFNSEKSCRNQAWSTANDNKSFLKINTRVFKNKIIMIKLYGKHLAPHCGDSEAVLINA